jgi:hypothetical protein
LRRRHPLTPFIFRVGDKAAGTIDISIVEQETI